MPLTIESIPVLRDNYVWLLHDTDGGRTAVVDPAVADPVLQRLSERGLSLDVVLNTHHHADHTGGNVALKQATGCTVVGAARDRARIPAIDIALGEGAVFELGTARARVLEIPGHTSGHIAFWFARDAAVFCGDTLFALGCGRLFEGTAAEMWCSLSRLRELPAETRVYCAHEYPQSNARFALTVDGANAELIARAAEIDRLRTAGRPTLPSTIGLELRTNPFLRGDDPALAAAVGRPGAPPDQVFAEVRRRKDAF